MTVSLKEDSHILIILMGSLGDVTRGLSLPKQIKTRYPKAKITWLIEPACEKIVRLNQYIDKVIVFSRPNPISGILKLKKELNAETYDLVLDLQRHFKSGFFSFLSGCKNRIGFHPSTTKEFNHFFNTDYIENAGNNKPKIEQYWNFLRKIGIEPTFPLDFGFSHIKESDEQKKVLSEMSGPYVGLVLGSSWESKDWPITGYAGLINRFLSETSLEIALFGDKTQSKIADEIKKHIPDARVKSFAGRTSLADLIALIDCSEYCIGPDSGPGHIAGALNKPYVSLFGPTDPILTAPFGSEHLVIQKKLGCIPCYRRSCPGLNKLCMRLISPEAVFEKLKEL